MNTCPGASHELCVEALDHEMIASAAILYLEGYLWGPDKPRAAMLKAIEIAHAAGREVAFTLSESVCIAGRKDRFAQMIDGGGVDLLFANEDEALQLTGRADLAAAFEELKAKVETLVDHQRRRGRDRDARRRDHLDPGRAGHQGRRHDRRRRPVRRGLPRRARQGRGLERACGPARSPRARSSSIMALGRFRT